MVSGGTGCRAPRQAAGLGHGDGQQLGNLGGGFGFGRRLFRQILFQCLAQEGDAAQLLPHTVVQVLGNAPLFMFADLKDFGFQPFAFADVLHDGRDTRDAARFILDGREGQRNVNQATVLPHPHRFKRFDRFLALDIFKNQRKLIAATRGNEDRDGTADDFFGGIAKHLFRSTGSNW